MTLSISNVLEAVRANIASITGENVILGTPVDSEPGLFILSYKISVDSTHRNPRPEVMEGMIGQSYRTHCLLIPSSSNNYVAIESGLRCLIEQPILSLENSIVRIAINSLPTEELAQIFISAGVTLRLAIPFDLNWNEDE